MAISGAHKKEKDFGELLHTPEDQAPNYDLSGAAIRQETIESEVKVAQAVEPEIALDAQHELDEQQQLNEAAQLQAAQDKKAQDARLPADVRKQQQSLQDAKDKLRRDESEEGHALRLANEERRRIAALKTAPEVEGKLAQEALEKITPRLSKIESDATAANKLRDDALVAQEQMAQVNKKQNEAHAKEQADRLKKAQDQAMLENVQFTSGKPIKTAAAQSKKIQDLQAQLASATAQNEVAIKTEEPVVGTAKVGALVTAFNRSREVEKPTQIQEPRRSQRIKEQVAKLEAEQKAQPKVERNVKPKAKRTR